KTQLVYELQQQCVARASAEEKALRIPQLETEALAREEQMALLRQEVTELKTARSELQTALENERKASKDKLALLNDAQLKLSDAFKALAAEALKSNNQSFLTLATQNLEAFQQQAKAELEKRQQAIGQLVTPVKETLAKLDSQVNQLE